MGKDLNGKELGIGLYQRKDGRYEGRYKDRYGKTKSVYDKNLRIVKTERNRLEREERLANPTEMPVCHMSLNEWVDIWLATYKHHVTDTSRARYQRAYIIHIAPTLGNRDIVGITNVDIVRLLNSLGSHLRVSTITFIKSLLSDIFEKAKINDIVTKNPVYGTKFSGLPVKERTFLNTEQEKEFVIACSGHIYENAFIVALHTGLRCGELFALRWCDIDMNKRKISVTRSLSYSTRANGKNEYQIDPPKTKRSIRTVYFDETCASALKRQFVKRSQIIQSKIYEPIDGFEDLLFVTKRGTPVCTHFIDAAINHIVDKYNETHDVCQLPKFSIHSLRHTYASRCFEIGIPPRVIQEQLGHTSMYLTMDLYTHIFDDHRQTEIAKFDQFYGGQRVGQKMVK